MATRRATAPTTEQMMSDPLMKLALKTWSSDSKSRAFDASIVTRIFENEIVKSDFNARRIMMLEFSRYLENYLWPNFAPEVCNQAFLMSVVCMVNEKKRESVPAWDIFKEKPEHFGLLFTEVMKTTLNEDVALPRRSVCLVFLNHCYNSIEVDIVRSRVLKTLTLASWNCLLPERLESEIGRSSRLKKLWKSIARKDAKASENDRKSSEFDRTFLSKLMNSFLKFLFSAEMDEAGIEYCQRFVQLMLDLDSCLVTRRNFNVLLDDAQLVVRCRQSKLYQHDDVFSQLVENLSAYVVFEVNDLSGEALTEQVLLISWFIYMVLSLACET